MSTSLSTQIDIDASPPRVWQVLTDLPAYHEWNPFIVQAEGRVEVNGRLRLRMQPVGGRAATLKPTVAEVAEGSRLRWRGTLGIPGLLDAEHVFQLTERNGGGSRLDHHEHFHGLLVPLFAKSLHRHTLPAFAAMNEALKVRAEGAVTPARG